MSAERIVSLLPGATETVAALGRAPDLIRSQSLCDVCAPTPGAA